MCGYCVEGAILLDFLEGETTAQENDFDEPWVSIYLQESQDMVGTLTMFQGSPHLTPYPSIERTSLGKSGLASHVKRWASRVSVQ